MIEKIKNSIKNNIKNNVEKSSLGRKNRDGESWKRYVKKEKEILEEEKNELIDAGYINLDLSKNTGAAYEGPIYFDFEETNNKNIDTKEGDYSETVDDNADSKEKVNLNKTVYVPIDSAGDKISNSIITNNGEGWPPERKISLDDEGSSEGTENSDEEQEGQEGQEDNEENEVPDTGEEGDGSDDEGSSEGAENSNEEQEGQEGQEDNEENEVPDTGEEYDGSDNENQDEDNEKAGEESPVEGENDKTKEGSRWKKAWNKASKVLGKDLDALQKIKAGGKIGKFGVKTVSTLGKGILWSLRNPGKALGGAAVAGIAGYGIWTILKFGFKKILPGYLYWKLVIKPAFKEHGALDIYNKFAGKKKDEKKKK